MDEKVICLLCKKQFEIISSFHLKIHGITFKEYKKTFPHAKISGKIFSQKRSESMRGKLGRIQLKGSDSPMWRGGKIKTNCAYCNKEIQRSRSQIEYSEKHFCCRKHYGLYRSSNIKSWNIGLTTKTDKRLKKIGKKISKTLKQRFVDGATIWNKGLTMKTDERVRKNLLSSFKTRDRKPSNFEKLFKEECKHRNLKDIRYTGDFDLWITVPPEFEDRITYHAINPDFVVKPFSQTKKLIELWGLYFHTDEEKKIREQLYNHLGYQSLFITDKEFNEDLERSMQKVECFVSV